MRRHGTMDRSLLAATVVGSLALSFVHCAAGATFEHCGLEHVRYEVILLGALGEGGGGADAINDRGEIVGATSLSNEVGRAFIWDCERGIQNMGSLGDDHFASLAYDINDRGAVVGQSMSMEISLAFIWDRANGMRPIVAGDALAYDINDRSEVILFGGPGGLSYWHPTAGAQNVTDRVGVDVTGDPFINNASTIGGMRAIANGDGPVFFNWNPRTGLRDLGVRPAAQFVTYMRGMNDRGDLIAATVVDDGWVPLLVTQEEQQLLEPPRPGADGWPSDINIRRQIVGRSTDLSDVSYPFIWDPRNGMRDLNTLSTKGAPLILNASGINNWGWIAGTAFREGAGGEAALIVPVPTNSKFFRNLPGLSGPRLCRALDALRVHAVVSCLLQGR